jgi:hypothetical protein
MNERDQKLAILLGVPVLAGGMVLAFDEPSQAAPAPEVVAVIASATDTIPVLSGLCLTVFAAGLAPWAARTALSWLSSIMRGAI